MIDFFYGYCINDTALQNTTKTEVVGLQKLKWLMFVCLFVCLFFSFLRYIWTDPVTKKDRDLWRKKKSSLVSPKHIRPMDRSSAVFLICYVMFHRPIVCIFKSVLTQCQCTHYCPLGEQTEKNKTKQNNNKKQKQKQNKKKKIKKTNKQ